MKKNKRNEHDVTKQKGEVMISKILVAVDGSETALKSVEYAAELAKQTGATLTLLSIIDKSHFLAQSIPAVASPTHLIELIEDYLRQAAEAYRRGSKIMQGQRRSIKKEFQVGASSGGNN